jgi:hypothetical protein
MMRLPAAVLCVCATTSALIAQSTPRLALPDEFRKSCATELTAMQKSAAEFDGALRGIQISFAQNPADMRSVLASDLADVKRAIAKDDRSNPRASAGLDLQFCLIQSARWALLGIAPEPRPTRAGTLDRILNQNGPADPRQCREAMEYVESPSGLLGEYDRAASKLKLRETYRADMQDIKQKLLDDTWWERSRGPDVAREVKFLSDVIVTVYSALVPAAEGIQAGKSMYDLDTLYGGSEDTILAAMKPSARDIVEHASDVSAPVIAASKNLDSVKDATVAAGAEIGKIAAEDVLKRALAKAGHAKLFPAVKILMAVYERSKTAEEAEEFKAVVHEQLERIDSTLAEVQAQLTVGRDAVKGVVELRSTVMQLCSK